MLEALIRGIAEMCGPRTVFWGGVLLDIVPATESEGDLSEHRGSSGHPCGVGGVGGWVDYA